MVISETLWCNTGKVELIAKYELLEQLAYPRSQGLYYAYTVTILRYKATKNLIKLHEYAGVWSFLAGIRNKSPFVQISFRINWLQSLVTKYVFCLTHPLK